jgi:hypothetical protein
MTMQIPIPLGLVRLVDRIQDWGSQTLYGPFRRMRDEQDVMDLAAMLVTVFDVDQIAIADALKQRRLELKLKTWNYDGEEA